MTRKTGYWLLAILWTSIIIFLLCLPGSKVPKTAGAFKFPPGTDMAVHVVLFAVLQILWVRSIQRTPTPSFPIAYCIIGFGIMMEFIQYFFVPNRSFEWEDIVADIAGVLIGNFLLKRWLKAAQNKKAPVETGAVTKTNCL
ncbi:MAG: VanZ family protein [Chitinophagaceae bacterium]